MTKEQIDKVVNEYLKFDGMMIGNGPHTDEEYDEQYKLWLEQMEKELNGKVG